MFEVVAFEVAVVVQALGSTSRMQLGVWLGLRRASIPENTWRVAFLDLQ